MTVPADDPLAFDAYLNSSRVTSAAEDIVGWEPLRSIRIAQAECQVGGIDVWRRHAEMLAGTCTAPARGLLLSIKVALRLYDEVLTADPEPTGATPIDLEDACLSHAAVGMSAAQVGDYARAQEHLRVALTLARALFLKHRSQMLELEWQRVRTLGGNAQPDEIRTLLIHALPGGRRAFGQRTLAAALFSLGSYRAALAALGTPDQDSPADAGLREWLHAVSQLPPSRDESDPLLDSSDPWVRLAGALRATLAGLPMPNLDGIVGEPQATYGQLLTLSHLSHDHQTAGVLIGLLKSRVVPERPDQMLHYGVMLLAAAVSLGVTDDMVAGVKIVETALGKLQSVEETVAILRRTAPEFTMLLALSPLGKLGMSNGAGAQPMLLGQVVVSGRERVRLPGRTGRTVVLEAAHVGERDDLTRAERRRLAEALVAFGGPRVVNMGGVLRSTAMIGRAFAQRGDHKHAAAWRESAVSIQHLLTEDVQSVLSLYPPAYLR